ncbi:TagK domain-containing protein [Xylophilus sp. Kf1]|nr:TagK domain-containing protein [Xylophilus sp. Kf1]
MHPMTTPPMPLPSFPLPSFPLPPVSSPRVGSPSLAGVDDDILSALGIADTVRPAAPDPFADLPRGRPPADAAPPDEPLIEALRREFDRVVADPAQLVGTADWPARDGRRQAPAPDLETLGILAAPFVHLRDMVMPAMSVDGCIHSFDGDAPSDFLVPPRPPEVLRLFAPDTPHAATVAGLPVQTRRDHQSFSTDTAVDTRRLGAYTARGAA